ncbi:hypothetical protein [Maricaulis sp.]|uniref:hypothetical protein n=1 Tax=unclassified Maricaulis TaxID=2632371 RepID=UPI001B2D19BD|nr:hypothetical protein [Maricaulis sp.]MBO6797272.1 hypothetical protein [Maricaulis sp.]
MKRAIIAGVCLVTLSACEFIHGEQADPSLLPAEVFDPDLRRRLRDDTVVTYGLLERNTEGYVIVLPNQEMTGPSTVAPVRFALLDVEPIGSCLSGHTGSFVDIWIEYFGREDREFISRVLVQAFDGEGGLQDVALCTVGDGH